MEDYIIPEELQGPPLSKYQKLEEIARGAYGVIYPYKRKRKSERRIPQIIAVKSIFKNEDIKNHIGRELEIILRLKHKNVVEILGVEQTIDKIFIKMEFAKCDLAGLQKKMMVDRYFLYEFYYLAYHIVNGLVYLHEQSISHRDVKPGNILAQWEDGGISLPPRLYSITLKLCDFGLSRSVPEESLTVTAVGSRSYMSPEVKLASDMGKNIHSDYKKADIFSTGVVLYEMWYNERPFTLTDISRDEEQELPFQKGDSEIRDLFSRMLKWSRKERCDANYAEEILRILDHSHEASLGHLVVTSGKNAIHKAAEFGNVEAIKWLIDSGVDINYADQGGWTALHHAVSSGHLSVVHFLINSVADLNKADNFGRTYLHSACKNGIYDVAELLIKKGVDVNKVDKSGQTPLQQACNEHHISVVKLLIETGADVNIPDDKGKLPIHLACERGIESLVRLIIESDGSCINRESKDGLTPLNLANRAGHSTVAKALVENGAWANVVPFKRHKATFAEMEEDFGLGKKALHKAAEVGNYDMIRWLIISGDDVNRTSDDGWSPLHFACNMGQISTAQILIESKANVNIAANDGRTPLHIASHGGHLSVVQLLIDKGGDVNRADTYGRTPLNTISWTGDLSISRLMIENGADVHAADNDGSTPLHIACERGHLTVAKLLIEQASCINRVENYGKTPLNIASYYGHLAIVQLLIAGEADINKVDKYGKTPLHSSCINGHIAIVQLFIDGGMDVNKADKSGSTPLHDACCNGHLPIAEVLLKNGADKNRKNNIG